MSTSDYASTINSHKPSRFNFKWPSLPFNRSARDGPEEARQFSMPFGGANKRSNSSIMDEAMRAAYGTDGASVYSAQGYLDEKRDPNYPIPEPAPVKQASIRKSIASWFRRSPGNHPLKLNPMSRWSRSTTATGSAAGAGSQYSASVYSVAEVGGGVPPMPDLALQRAYTTAGASMGTGTPSNPAELASVFVPADEHGPAQPASHWSASSIGSGAAGPGPVEMMSEADGTWSSERRTTAGPGPPSHLFSSNAGGLLPGEAGTVTGTVTGTGAGAAGPSQRVERLTNLHEELLNLYAHGESAAAAEQEVQGKSGTAAGR